MTEGKERLLTLNEVAAAFGVTGQTIRKRIIAGHLPGCRYGRNWRVPASALELWYAHKAAEAMQATAAH